MTTRCRCTQPTTAALRPVPFRGSLMTAGLRRAGQENCPSSQGAQRRLCPPFYGRVRRSAFCPSSRSLRSDLPIDRSGDCRAATCTLQGLVTAGLRRAGRETSAIGGVQNAAPPTVVFSVIIGCRRGLASDHEEPLYLEQVVRSNSWRHDYSLSS